MEKTIKQTNTVAFMGKDQQWHFINEDTWELGYEEEIIILNGEDIPVDKETQSKVIEILNNRK